VENCSDASKRQHLEFRPPAIPADAVPSTAEAELTAREKDVLHLLLDGLLYKKIADTMSVSTETVNFHIQKIYHKLHCRSRAQVVARYMKP
jgi:DNA-binding CsgD family transcriptional regulator